MCSFLTHFLGVVTILTRVAFCVKCILKKGKKRDSINTICVNYHPITLLLASLCEPFFFSRLTSKLLFIMDGYLWYVEVRKMSVFGIEAFKIPFVIIGRRSRRGAFYTNAVAGKVPPEWPCVSRARANATRFWRNLWLLLFDLLLVESLLINQWHVAMPWFAWGNFTVSFTAMKMNWAHRCHVLCKMPQELSQNNIWRLRFSWLSN